MYLPTYIIHWTGDVESIGLKEGICISSFHFSNPDGPMSSTNFTYLCKTKLNQKTLIKGCKSFDFF